MAGKVNAVCQSRSTIERSPRPHKFCTKTSVRLVGETEWRQMADSCSFCGKTVKGGKKWHFGIARLKGTHGYHT